MGQAERVVDLGEERRRRRGDQADGSTEAPEGHEVPRTDAEARAWLDALMRSHGERLAGWFTFKLRDRDLARDLVIETFYRAWRSRQTFRGEAKPSTWLWTIGRRTLAAHFETKRRLSPEVATDELPERPEAPRDEDQGRVREALVDCFQQLNEQIQRTAELVWLLGHSFVEAAEILEESPDTVRMRLKRARAPLQECLESKGIVGCEA